jgi:hypothetical protein
MTKKGRPKLTIGVKGRNSSDADWEHEAVSGLMTSQAGVLIAGASSNSPVRHFDEEALSFPAGGLNLARRWRMPKACPRQLKLVRLQRKVNSFCF